jgi:hypothetical protein
MERSLLNVQQQLHVFMASLPTQVRDSLNDDPEMQELFRIGAGPGGTQFGKRKYNRGARRDGQWIIEGAERGNVNQIFLKVVPDRMKETLVNLIFQHNLVQRSQATGGVHMTPSG